MNEIVLSSLLKRDIVSEGPSLRKRCADYGVMSIRALVASILAREYHYRLYGVYGELGEPISPIQPIDAGYSQDYVGGRINILDNNNFLPTAEVTCGGKVEYVGFRCNEPNESVDEPYIIFSVVSLNPHFDGRDSLVAVNKIGPLDNVREGNVVGDVQTVWQGRVPGTGLKIALGVFEHDLGDPDDVREEIETKLREYAQKAASAIAQAYGAGTVEAEQIAGSEIVTWAVRILSLGITEILDLGDDEIGRQSEEVPQPIIRKYSNQDEYSASLLRNDEGLVYNYKKEVVSDEGNYSIYFRVSGFEIGPITRPPDPIPAPP